MAPSSSVSPADAPTRCVDPLGDGPPGRGGGDLTSVEVTAGADSVQVTWQTSLDITDLTDAGSVVTFDLDLIQVGNDPDRPRVTFLVTAKDGGFETPFADRIPHEYVDAIAPAAVAGTTLTATFPADVLTGLGPTWTLRSTLTQAGSIADECPG